MKSELATRHTENIKHQIFGYFWTNFISVNANLTYIYMYNKHNARESVQV